MMTGFTKIKKLINPDKSRLSGFIKGGSSPPFSLLNQS